MLRYKRCLLTLELRHLDHKLKQKFCRQRTPHSSWKETVNKDILKRYKNRDIKIMQLIKITSRRITSAGSDDYLPIPTKTTSTGYVSTMSREKTTSSKYRRNDLHNRFCSLPNIFKQHWREPVLSGFKPAHKRPGYRKKIERTFRRVHVRWVAW